MQNNAELRNVAVFTRETALSVKQNDWVKPVDWNRSSSNKFDDEVKDLQIKKATSQTGTLFLVQHRAGNRSWLDAGWFTKGSK